MGSFLDFKKKIAKLNESRTHKITNSYGVYDAYKFYRKTKPKDKKYILTESQYFYIIREINNKLAEILIDRGEISFPCRMGKLELRKFNSYYRFKNDKVVTNLPIDWDKTLALWSSDKEAFDNKTLVKIEETELFKIKYNKSKANYNNKIYYDFNVNRNIKIKLKTKIKEGSIDAFLL